MGQVKKIIERMKNENAQRETAVHSIQQPVDLPGLHRAEGLKAEELNRRKKEYNRCIKWIRDGNKKLKTLKGERKKDEKKSLAGTKAHMHNLLTQIGSYTADEKMYGFKEVRDAQ